MEKAKIRLLQRLEGAQLRQILGMMDKSPLYNPADFSYFFEGLTPKEMMSKYGKEWRIHVAEKGGKIMGFNFSILHPNGQSRSRITFVHPEHRGEGTSYALLRSMLGWMRSRGVRFVDIKVANEHLERSFNRRGIRKITDRKSVPEYRIDLRGTNAIKQFRTMRR